MTLQYHAQVQRRSESKRFCVCAKSDGTVTQLARLPNAHLVVATDGPNSPCPLYTEPPASRCPQFSADRAYAEELIAQAITSPSWTRNKSWIDKFVAYISRIAAESRTTADVADAIDDTELILAFLGSVAREQPEAKTRVDAAKRALNFVRAVAELPPLDENINVRLLAKSTRNRKSATVNQSPLLPVSFLHCMMQGWGAADIWWKIQTVLMTFLAFCSLGRGDEVCACLRTGIAWVRQSGALVHDDDFVPGHHCKDKQCRHANCVRGFMILFPSRKNSQSTPAWIPIASAAAVDLMIRHLEWMKRICPLGGKYMFLPRQAIRSSGKRIYTVPLNPRAGIDVASYRTLLRQCIMESCEISKQLANKYGTHSPRLGAVELLRKHGVPAELRQQMGQWMSQQVALRYLQLSPGEQFDVLHAI